MRSLIVLGSFIISVNIVYAGRYATSTKIYVQQNNWKKALESIEKWKQEEPNSAEPYLWEAYVKTRQEDYAGASKLFLKAYRMQPKLFKKKEFEKKLSITGQKLLTYESFLIVLMNGAVQLYNDQKYDEALEVLKFIVELDPKNGNAYNMLASIYQLKAVNENKPKYLSEALKYLEKYHELNPDDPKANYFLGKFYYDEALNEKDETKRKKLLEKARKFLEFAVKKGYKDAYYELGLLYSDMGDNKKALEYLKKYAKDSDEFEVWFNLAVVAIEAKDDETAYEALKKCVEIDPENYQVNYLLSVMEAEMGNYENALMYIDKALSIKETPEAYEHKAAVLGKLGRSDESIEAYKKAKSLKKSQ